MLENHFLTKKIVIVSSTVLICIQLPQDLFCRTYDDYISIIFVQIVFVANIKKK